ncbi:MAG: TM2 domain-containing protein [Bacteroidetes bacterium]|nr:TM2 domain-containing protein [Bacteroidota bacterium]
MSAAEKKFQLNEKKITHFSSADLFQLRRDTSAVSHHAIKENKKLIAAILAFPVPFGVLGLHRIYLGTDPWVPVAYMLTLGGAGIISMIDFIEIVSADDATLQSFEHNGKFFMWVK